MLTQSPNFKRQHDTVPPYAHDDWWQTHSSPLFRPPYLPLDQTAYLPSCNALANHAIVQQNLCVRTVLHLLQSRMRLRLPAGPGTEAVLIDW